MSDKTLRQEILDLLARGKISIDEAVEMLEQNTEDTVSIRESEPLYKAEMDREYIDENSLKVDEADLADPIEKPGDSKMSSESKQNGNGQRPRWLRIRVLNSDTGNSKLMVNVPISMVKFGLGVAQIFSPELKNIGLNEINDLMNDIESGLLVEVQDEESKEHVRVFFE